MEATSTCNSRRFSNSCAKTSSNWFELGFYWFWAALRIILTLLPQTGYIHPDEYFQSVEVIAGEVFKTEVVMPWEFNKTFPIRSISLIYSTIYLPFSILRSAAQFLEVYAGSKLLSPYMLLVIPRLTMCLISFISDYCLYKICYLFGQNYKERLIIYSSSYVTLIFMTRTFSNTLEIMLFNLMLYLVAACIAETEKTLYQHNYLKTKYKEAETIADRVKINKLIKLLPKHSLAKCIPIAVVSTAGLFNRPTFAFYAIAPLFCWFERGLSATSFLRDFHVRIFVFIMYCSPMLCFFIFFDSVYYGYITLGEILNNGVGLNNFVVTPLNFARYNLDQTNLSQHGLHPRFLHALVNIPLLFNILGLCGLMVIVKLVIRSGTSNWTLLPKSQSITGMMTISFISPLAMLSVFPHQEPRFLTPVILPMVFLYSHLISNFDEECETCAPYRKRFRKERKAQGLFKYPLKCINYVERITENVDNRYNINGRYLSSIKIHDVMKKDKKKNADSDTSRDGPARRSNCLLVIWHISNLICTVFFGFVHQGGLYPLAKHFHNELQTKPRYTTYHLVTSHIYSFPLHLLMLKSSYKAKNPNFQMYELGTENFENIHSKIINVLNVSESKRKSMRRNYKVFYAFPTSILNEFTFSYSNYSENYTYSVVDVYYPHFSSEALPNFKLNVSNEDEFRMSANSTLVKMFDVSPVRYVVEFFHQFGLAVLQVSLHET